MTSEFYSFCAALALFGGCTPTVVDGTVLGVELGVQSATFAEVPGVWGDDGAVLVWLLPQPDACKTMTDWMSVSESSRNSTELSDVWNATFPADFWEVDLVLRVADPHANQTGEWLLGTGFDEEVSTAGQAYAEFAHSKTARDSSYFAGLVEDPDSVVQKWYSHKGLLQIHNHRPGDTLTGIFTTEAADPDTGKRVGDLFVRFNADHCADVEAILTR